jgi:hypothetical protein
MDAARYFSDTRHVVLGQAHAKQKPIYIAPVTADHALGQKLSKFVSRPLLPPIRIQCHNFVKLGRDEGDGARFADEADYFIIPFQIAVSAVRGLPRPPIGGFGRICGDSE